MSIETAGYGTLVVILIMAAVTLATRWGGVFVMSFVPINYRVQQFITAMSGSVLVAVLAPLAVKGDNGARLALLTTAIVMLTLKKPLPAIAAGILTSCFSQAVLKGRVAREQASDETPSIPRSKTQRRRFPKRVILYARHEVQRHLLWRLDGWNFKLPTT